MTRIRLSLTGARLSLTAVLACALALAGTTSGAQGSLVARPLKGPVPAWYTPDLHQQVLAAGARGVPLPAAAETEIPASSLAFLGIRPGQLIIVDDNALCSSNLVFTSSSGGAATYYIGTAGHCGKTGDPVVMLFLPLGLVHIGDIVHSTDAGVGKDFALIRIKPELNSFVSPSMAHWGGPTGVYSSGGPITVHHSGWGLGVGTGGTPRAGLAYLFTSSEWRFESAVAPGDSGSGAIVTGGPAAGNITHIVIDTRQTVPAYMAGTSMVKIMSMVGGLELATCAPIPWPAPGCPPIG